MESFSRTLDTYTSSYIAKRRKRRLVIFFLSLVSLALIGLLFFLITTGGSRATPRTEKPTSKQLLYSEWQARNWDLVLLNCSKSLLSAPLDPFYLGFAGLSSFYKANTLPESEERSSLIDQAVVLLRKTLVVTSKTRRKYDIPKAELEYVLGKSYFFKGTAYYNETITWIERSIADGYTGEDSLEFLAVSNAGLGRTEKAISYFESALDKKRGDLLLIAAGKAYFDANKLVESENLLNEALAKSTDVLTREKCRFLIAAIDEKKGDYSKAREQLEQIILENPQSAEGHYRLGLIFQKIGDAVKARSEWRRATAIDPMHSAARLKLSEKL